MLLLITNTSGKQGSVALARAGEDAGSKDVELIEETPLVGGTFSAQLVPQIAALLTRHGFGKADIGAFVVISGPGSFTGLRVGLAAIKALAEILQKPIVPVSLLEVIALAGGTQGPVLAALDAGRGEVYVGEYEVAGDRARLLQEQLLRRDELYSMARSAEIATPDQSLLAAAQGSGISVCGLAQVGAQAIATVGWGKLKANLTVSPDQLEANYIRRSDAEIFSKPGR